MTTIQEVASVATDSAPLLRRVLALTALCALQPSLSRLSASEPDLEASAALHNFSDVLELLDQRSVNTDNERTTVTFPTKKGQLKGTMSVRWQDRDGAVQIIQTMPVKVSIDRLPELHMTLTLLNDALAIPGVGFSMSTQVLYYRLTVPFQPRGYISQRELRTYMKVALNNAAELWPLLARIAEGDADPIAEVRALRENSKKRQQSEQSGVSSDFEELSDSELSRIVEALLIRRRHDPCTLPVPSLPPLSPSRGTSEGQLAGEVRMFTGLNVRFCWCPAGSFVMGSPATEEGRHNNEAPVNVTLSRGFWLGQTEVTQGLWKSVMGTEPWIFRGSLYESEDHPAVFVSWKDANEFCRKLTSQERDAGRLSSEWSYALPTEAQWEYACRAGTKTAYSFGDDASLLHAYAWERYWDLREAYAHRVGLKPPNQWGLLDIHGNVAEWCQDAFRERLPGGRDPMVSAVRSGRINRGGCFRSSAEECRSARRQRSGPSRQTDFVGFRLALSQTGH